MKPADRLKMCPNCDGRIPLDATQCPYCFSHQQSDTSAPKNFTPSSDPLSALYPPPYSTQVNETPTKTTPIPEAAETGSIPFWSIFMLALGSNLLTLGILQFFFSDHGTLRLEMNASYWFLMVLVGAPLIYVGLKNLSQKK